MLSVSRLHCPLRALPAFAANGADELRTTESLRDGQTGLRAGGAIIREGQRDSRLAILFYGWALRYMTVADGRRQILSFLLPGDFIGLQPKLTDESPHGVEALTDVVLCTLPRDAAWELHRRVPALGYDITWLAAHEGAIVDENLLSVGRRNATERIAMLLLRLHCRARSLGAPGAGGALRFPMTQQHIADALGLSLVHTNKTLARLQRQGLFRLAGGALATDAPDALERVAQWPGCRRPAAHLSPGTPRRARHAKDHA